jgi:Arc/MetJ family transcription regulator
MTSSNSASPTIGGGYGRGATPYKQRAFERQRRALELRSAGATYEQIAQALGYAGTAGARHAVKLALKATLREPAEEVRQMALDRLDVALRAIWPRIVAGDDAAIASLIRLEKRRAELLGLDAPTRTELTGKDGRPIQVEARPPLDFGLLSDEELELLSALGERLRAGEVVP